MKGHHKKISSMRDEVSTYIFWPQLDPLLIPLITWKFNNIIKHAKIFSLTQANNMLKNIPIQALTKKTMFEIELMTHNLLVYLERTKQPDQEADKNVTK